MRSIGKIYVAASDQRPRLLHTTASNPQLDLSGVRHGTGIWFQRHRRRSTSDTAPATEQPTSARPAWSRPYCTAGIVCRWHEVRATAGNGRARMPNCVHSQLGVKAEKPSGYGTVFPVHGAEGKADVDNRCGRFLGQTQQEWLARPDDTNDATSITTSSDNYLHCTAAASDQQQGEGCQKAGQRLSSASDSGDGVRSVSSAAEAATAVSLVVGGEIAFVTKTPLASAVAKSVKEEKLVTENCHHNHHRHVSRDRSQSHIQLRCESPKELGRALR